MQKYERYALWVTLLGCAAITSVMFAYFKWVTGLFFPSVLPEVVSDGMYYLTQIKEVLDGHPLLGNPYIIEHVQDRFPGLIAPIWITSIPGLLGLHINSVFIVNAFLYSMLLGGLLYMICNKLNNKRVWVSAFLALLGVASVHNLMMRPAIMQTVYPAFALFTLALIGVITQPQARKQYVFLGLTTALSFYLYPYLWMITFTVVGLLVLMSLWKRDWPVFKYLVVMGIGIVIVCIPQILLTVDLLTNELGQELHGRIGLVKTHLIHPYAILFSKYTILTVVSLLLLRIKRPLSKPETVAALLTCALLIATFSNVITGKEMHFDTHFWRIGMFVNIIAIAVFIEVIKQGTVQRLIACVCLAGLLLTTVNRVAIRAGGFAYLKQTEEFHQYQRDIQGYAEVFSYIEKERIENKVILSSSPLSAYIPIYTKNYIFSYGPERSHTISNAELLERFLLLHVDRINTKFIKDNLVTFSGWSAEREAALKNAYGENVDRIELLGGDAYIDAILTQVKEIDKTYDSTLRKYQVDYIIIDSLSDNNPRLPKDSKRIFETDRFTIYSL